MNRKIKNIFIFSFLIATCSERSIHAESDVASSLKPSQKESDDALFEMAFGKKQKEKRIKLPLFLDRLSLGEVSFYIKGDKLLFVNSFELKFALARKINQEMVDKIPDSEKLAIKDLPDGILIKLFVDSLYSSVELAPYYYENNRIISDVYPEITGKKIYTASPFSHIFNYWYDFNRYENSGDEHSLDFSSAFNINSFVLENEFHWQKDFDENKLTRRQSTLTKDFESSGVRFQVGDVTFPTMNMQSQLTLLGATFKKEHTINPYRKIKPVNQFEFILDHKSYVTILVNDRPVRSEILDKGKHSIEDLVLDFGRNNIKIMIKDFGGEEKVYSYNWSGSNDLLRAGYNTYALSLGVKNTFKGVEPNYGNSDDYVLSANYMQGMSNNLTLGTFLQNEQEQSNLGASAFTSFSFGNLRFENSLSKNKLENDGQSKVGFSSELELENNLNSRFGDIRTILSYNYKSPFYSQFDSILKENVFRDTFRFDLSWYFNNYLNYSAGYDLQVASRAYDEDRITYSLGLGVRPFKNGVFNFSYQYRSDEDGKIENLFNMFFNYSFDDDHTYISTYHDLENHVNQVSLNHYPNKSQDSFYYRSRYNDEIDGQNASLSIGYRSRYFESEVTGVAHEGESDQINARLRGSIISTSSHTTFSTPVYDSFAYIKGKNSLEDKKIGLLNDVGGTGKKEFKNIITVPQLSSYHYFPVYMDPTHLEFGTSYDFEHFYLFPKYRSVVEVELGNVKSFTVYGKFKSSKLALKTGEMIRNDGFSVPFFTNRKGQFVVESMMPGSYEIFIENKKTRYDFNISDAKNPVINIGEL